MIASLFDEDGFCAVYAVEKLHDGNVRFGDNSYRGDVYQDVLRPLVETYRSEHGSNRIGPFSIPVDEEDTP